MMLPYAPIPALRSLLVSGSKMRMRSLCIACAKHVQQMRAGVREVRGCRRAVHEKDGVRLRTGSCTLSREDVCCMRMQQLRIIRMCQAVYVCVHVHARNHVSLGLHLPL